MRKPNSCAIVLGLLLLGCQNAQQQASSEVRQTEEPLKTNPQQSDPEAEVAKTEPRPSEHRLLLLSIEDDSVVITAQRTVDEPLNAHPRRVGLSAWSFDALGADGRLLHQDNFAQPGLVRGEFKNVSGDENSPPDHVAVELDGPHHVQIRVPLRTHKVNFYLGTVEHRGEQVLNQLSVTKEEQP